MSIEKAWENNRDSFAELPKAEFDVAAKRGDFQEGPLIAEPSKFMREYGPYSPERRAFGKLRDGRKVCTQIV